MGEGNVFDRALEHEYHKEMTSALKVSHEQETNAKTYLNRVFVDLIEYVVESEARLF